MQYSVIKGTVIYTPKKYAENDTWVGKHNIGKYSTCVLSTSINKSSVITLIDYDAIDNANRIARESIHLDLTYTKTGDKFVSQSCMMYDKNVPVHVYYACNIEFPTLEEAKKEYVKLNLLWGIS